jgi:hypothetical protein
MRKMLSDRKAVSEVIATVLLILLVTIGMGILFGFVANYTSNYQTGQGSSVLESLTVEDIWFNHPATPANNQIDMWVYNTGKVDTTLNSIYINGALIINTNINVQCQNIYVNGVRLPSTHPDYSKLIIPVNGHAEFYITVPPSLNIPLNEHSYYDIKITTNRGSSFEGNYYYQ